MGIELFKCENINANKLSVRQCGDNWHLSNTNDPQPRGAAVSGPKRGKIGACMDCPIGKFHRAHGTLSPEIEKTRVVLKTYVPPPPKPEAAPEEPAVLTEARQAAERDREAATAAGRVLTQYSATTMELVHAAALATSVSAALKETRVSHSVYNRWYEQVGPGAPRAAKDRNLEEDVESFLKTPVGEDWGQLEKHVFPIRFGVTASVEIPRDISAKEADRLCAFVRTLVVT